MQRTAGAAAAFEVNEIHTERWGLLASRNNRRSRPSSHASPTLEQLEPYSRTGQAAGKDDIPLHSRAHPVSLDLGVIH